MPKRDITWARRAFYSQRAQAAFRGIGWEFTFEQWLAWWGDDIAYRGTSADKLQMHRLDVDGPFAEWNTIKSLARNTRRRIG